MMKDSDNPDAGSGADEILESERRLIQKELFLLEDQKEVAEHRYKMMFENALVGLFRVDAAQKRLITANREVARIYGFESVDELIFRINTGGVSFASFRHIPPPDELDTDEPYSFSTRIMRLDGGQFWARFSIRYSDDGDYIEGAVKDISDQVEAMEQLRRAKADAEEANAAKSRFLATMSHEIRTPLNGIVGFAEIIAGKRTPGTEYAGKILDESAMLILLITQLLAFTKLEADKIVLENTLMDLLQVLDESEGSLLKTMTEKGLSFRRIVGEDVPRWFLGDPLRLGQILTNLLSNAVKFTHIGGVVLSVSRVESRDESHLVSFSVTDTGIGIPEDKREQIFSSFVQADTSISRRYGGTGLGIPICRQLVNLMGGELTVRSRKGEGSEFSFVIPMMTPPDTLDGVPVSRPGRLSDFGDLDGKRILLVEDYDTNREIARYHLEAAGCKVIHAENGKKALDVLAGETPVDLILMDVHMPVMDGLEAARALRERGVKTPVIGMTASAYAEDRRRCLEAGMNDFLPKPLRRADLLARAVDWVAVSSLGGGFTDRPVTDEPSEIENVLSRIPVSRRTCLRYNDLLDEFGGDEESVSILFDGFESDFFVRMAAARRALTAGDARIMHREIHSVKGGAMNLMADELTQAALELERAVKAFIPESDESEPVNLETLAPVLDELEDVFSRLQDARRREQEKNETHKRQSGPL